MSRVIATAVVSPWLNRRRTRSGEAQRFAGVSPLGLIERVLDDLCRCLCACSADRRSPFESFADARSRGAWQDLGKSATADEEGPSGRLWLAASLRSSPGDSLSQRLSLRAGWGVPLRDALVIVDRPRGSAFGTGQGAFDDAPDNPALAAVQYLHPGVSLEGLRLNGPPLA
jgi:hypothetical protein